MTLRETCSLGCALVRKTQVVNPLIFIFLCSFLSLELEVSSRTFLSSVFRVCCALLCPPVPATRGFCLCEPWRWKQSRWKASNLSVRAALSFAGLGEKGGGSSAFPDLPDFSPKLFPVCCRKCQMMRKSQGACLPRAARLRGSDQSWPPPRAGLQAQPPMNEPLLPYRPKTRVSFEGNGCEVRHSQFLRKDSNQTRCPCI